MPRPAPVVPPYRHHKSRDLAYTLVAGRRVYLGRYGSPESKSKHARIVREAATGAPVVGDAPRVDPSAVTVAQVLAAFWSHAKATYGGEPAREGRRPTGELGNYYDPVRIVQKLFGDTLAVDFGPRALMLVQAEMAARGWCRNVINRNTNRVRHIFKWAVSQELLPGEVHHRLATVGGLRRGHKGVRDTAPVPPVDDEHVNATLRFCSPRIAAMVQVQRLTGMRSSNLCDLRTSDIDVTGESDGVEMWVYRPRAHKTKYLGHDLAIDIGPKAQEILRPYLKPDRPEAYVFSPAEAMAELRAERSKNRRAPLSCGNRPGSNVKATPKKQPGDRYTANSYALCVKKACDKANLWAKGGRIIGDDERAIPHWHPHQLRHARGTEVRAAKGLDGAQAALGHRSAAMAERYGKIKTDVAQRIALELG
jgi:integrase